MQKKPTSPQGNGPLEVWLRTILLPFVYSLELTSVVGLKKIANPNGGYALVKKDDAGGGTQFPFQVYRSDQDNLRIMLTEGYIVTTGAPFQPTNMGTYVSLGENGTYWVYLNITSATAATIVASTAMPTWSTSKIMVAKVVTTTTDSPLTILQILRENPQIPCV